MFLYEKGGKSQVSKLIPNYMNLDDISITEAVESDLEGCRVARINYNDLFDKKKYPYVKEGMECISFLWHLKRLKEVANMYKASPMNKNWWRDHAFRSLLNQVDNQSFILEGMTKQKVLDGVYFKVRGGQIFRFV